MKVIRAEAMGLCFGVRDALRAVDEIDDPSSVTVFGELVHNGQVLVQLETRGFQMTPEASRTGIPRTPRVLITAHGVSNVQRSRLLEAGKELIDTTCPLVRRAHRAALALCAEGFHVIVIGTAGHVEVSGLTEDLDSFHVVDDPANVGEYPHARLGVVCQTTVPPRLVAEIRQAIRTRNPQATIRFVDTVCQPTIDRQQAMERLCRVVEVMVVVGGRQSNNTRRLAEFARARGVTTYQVETAVELDPVWFEGIRAVGLTAGTSTLDQTTDEVYATLRRMNGSNVSTKERPDGRLLDSP